MSTAGKLTRCLRLRGIPFSAKENDVKKFFHGLNVLEVIFLNNGDGRPSGECYCKFDNDEELEAARAKDKQMIGRRYIEIFSVGELELSTYEEKMRKFPIRSNRNAGYIRVRGMPFKSTTSDVKSFFKDFNVEEVIIGKEPGGWGRPTGEAYVRFASKQEAEKAMQLNGQHMGHRYLDLYSVDHRTYEIYKSQLEEINQPKAHDRLVDDFRFIDDPYLANNYDFVAPFQRGGSGLGLRGPRATSMGGHRFSPYDHLPRNAVSIKHNPNKLSRGDGYESGYGNINRMDSLNRSIVDRFPSIRDRFDCMEGRFSITDNLNNGNICRDRFNEFDRFGSFNNFESNGDRLNLREDRFNYRNNAFDRFDPRVRRDDVFEEFNLREGVPGKFNHLDAPRDAGFHRVNTINNGYDRLSFRDAAFNRPESLDESFDRFGARFDPPPLNRFSAREREGKMREYDSVNVQSSEFDRPGRFSERVAPSVSSGAFNNYAGAEEYGRLSALGEGGEKPLSFFGNSDCNYDIHSPISRSMEQQTTSHEFPLGPMKLHMRGLPFQVTGRQVEEFFAPIRCVEVKVGFFENGRATGDGIVEFENLRDAELALKKDHECMGKRYIELFSPREMHRSQLKIPYGAYYKTIGGTIHHKKSRPPSLFDTDWKI